MEKYLLKIYTREYYRVVNQDNICIATWKDLESRMLSEKLEKENKICGAMQCVYIENTSVQDTNTGFWEIWKRAYIPERSLALNRSDDAWWIDDFYFRSNIEFTNKEREEGRQERIRVDGDSYPGPPAGPVSVWWGCVKGGPETGPTIEGWPPGRGLLKK